MNFVFYDTETSGIDKAFDQILQFGAILTDASLKEIDRFEIRARLNPFVVAAPQALLTTGLKPGRLTDPSLPSHFEMMRAIRAKLDKWSPAIFVGHNSIGFDEAMLRQAFYQTLHQPYLTNMNGNGRMDSLKVSRAVDLLAPGTLTVPRTERDRRSFKLDQLAPANGFNHHVAHDAMGDVEATLFLCRLMKERSDELWSQFVVLAHKPAVLDFIEANDIFTTAEFQGGESQAFLVTLIEPAIDRGSDALLFDLSHDPEPLGGLDEIALADALTEAPHMVRALRTNGGPCLVDYQSTPAEIRSSAPSETILRRRADIIRTHMDLRARLLAAYKTSRPVWEASPHIEQQIYDGFFGAEDLALANRFHTDDWAGRLSVAGKFADKRLRQLAHRLIYLEAPDHMSAELKDRYDQAIAERLAGEEEKPWLTLQQAIEETDRLLGQAKDAEAAMLDDYSAHLKQRLAEAKAKLSKGPS